MSLKIRSMRFRNSSRSVLSLNIGLRSIPRIITWCRAPGASIRDCLGIVAKHNVGVMECQLIYLWTSRLPLLWTSRLPLLWTSRLPRLPVRLPPKLPLFPP
ncbi:hypothetical protein DESC_590155 [Desulfosarcina cetonica]|nr:hypothetical protein DESC_590155 [Desulfosarcina cetonica]